MEALNRKIHPDYHTIEDLNIIPSQLSELSNKIPVSIINGGTQDVIKLDFIFDAGIWYQPSPIIASMTNSMLNEGTTNLTAAQIAEKFDYYGAYIGFNTSHHQAGITLYSMNKYLPDTLALVEDLIKNPIFPQKEFATILNKKKQNFIIEQEKTKILARDKFCSLLYGKSHPYTNDLKLEDFDKLTPEMLKQFHSLQYTPTTCNIIAAGKVDSHIISLLESHFGGSSWSTCQPSDKVAHSIRCDAPQECFLEKEDAVQSAIRIGRPLFNKQHPDYIGMQLLNMILGGYFGSRLMSNIREDKGYTYGIGSVLVSFQEGGHFTIITEVGSEVCSLALKEIYHEIARLRDELVTEEELNLVKNYMTGEILRNLDGPFSLSDSLKSNIPYGLDNSYYQKFIQEIKETSSQRIHQLANTYLQQKDLYQVVAGKEHIN